jgi:hypothetical protein
MATTNRFDQALLTFSEAGARLLWDDTFKETKERAAMVAIDGTLYFLQELSRGNNVNECTMFRMDDMDNVQTWKQVREVLNKRHPDAMLEEDNE